MSISISVSVSKKEKRKEKKHDGNDPLSSFLLAFWFEDLLINVIYSS
jgi:hypothetical protein